MLLSNVDYSNILRESFPFFLIYNLETDELVTNKNTRKLFPDLKNTNFSTFPDELKKLLKTLLSSDNECMEAEFEMDDLAQKFLLHKKLLPTGATLITGQPVSDFLMEKEAKMVYHSRSFVEQANMSILHEIRRPLFNLLLGIEELKSTLNTEDQQIQDKINFLERNRKKIEVTTEKLLFPQSLISIDKSSIALSTLVSRLEEKVMDDIKFTEIKFSVGWAIDKGTEVFIDFEKTVLALENLLLNAVEAVDPKDGNIGITLSEKDSKFLELIVEDNGPGIADKYKPMLFKPYFTTKQNGLGIGLATAKKIFDVQEINVKVESEEKKGSRFFICIPL